MIDRQSNGKKQKKKKTKLEIRLGKTIPDSGIVFVFISFTLVVHKTRVQRRIKPMYAERNS